MDELFGGESLRGAHEALMIPIELTYAELASDGLVPLERMPPEYRAPMGKSGRCGTHCGRGHSVKWGVGVEVKTRPAAWTAGRVEMLPRTVVNSGTPEPAPAVGYWVPADATLDGWRAHDTPMIVPCWREEDMLGQIRLRTFSGAVLPAVGAGEVIRLVLWVAWSS